MDKPTKPTLEQIKPATTKSEGLWLVKVDGAILGMLTRYKNTRTETHPWKAFKGHGMNASYIGPYFDEDNEGNRLDGKAYAIKAILNS